MQSQGMHMKRMHVIVKGRVQGVFFRARMQHEARALGLTGWVKNLSDGTVEAVWEGRDHSLAAMLEWSRHGAPPAIVTDVQVSEETYTGDYNDFHVRY